MKATVLSDWGIVPAGQLRGSRIPALSLHYRFKGTFLDGPNGTAICQIETDGETLNKIRSDDRFAILEESE